MVDRNTVYVNFSLFTFQSGYILITLRTSKFNIRSLLYIPIWLYSNVYKERRFNGNFLLYIPIWLYSNEHRGLMLVRSRMTFTFQSGYILMDSAFDKLQSIFTFTFQSGYILIRPSDGMPFGEECNFTFQSGYILIHLRSTSSLYIPIWLYSNDTQTFVLGTKGFFTFQSGYILIFLAVSKSSI